MRPITKSELKRKESEVKKFVCEVAVDLLNTSFKRSKYKPLGGFRHGWGYSFKVYGLLDVVTINARTYMDEKNSMYRGRLMINGNIYYTTNTEKQFDRIIKSLNGYENEGIKYVFEHAAANGNCLWFAWSIQ